MYDLIIIGGGVAGLTLACALADSDVKIGIVEANAFQKKQAPMHARVSAYNLAAKRFFQEHGVWDRIPQEKISPFEHIEVWDSRGSGQIQFDCVEVAQPALAYNVENQLIIEALLAQLSTFSNVELFSPMAASAVSIDEDSVAIHCDELFKAKLIVGADGANSWLRNYLNIGIQQHSYGQNALVCNVKTEKQHDRTARQIFLETGPLAFLPMRDPHSCSIVWSTTPEQAEFLMSVEDNIFIAELEKAFQYRLGAVTEKMDQTLMFPLTMRHIDHYVSHRVAFIGDAAHTIHPLAGQGINLGIQDAISLAKVILKTHASDRDIGRRQNLRAFERDRRGDNQLMISAMQGFKSLFGTELPWLKNLRNYGLNAVNSSSLLKKQIMRMMT